MLGRLDRLPRMLWSSRQMFGTLGHRCSGAPNHNPREEERRKKEEIPPIVNVIYTVLSRIVSSVIIHSEYLSVKNARLNIM